MLNNQYLVEHYAQPDIDYLASVIFHIIYIPYSVFTDHSLSCDRSNAYWFVDSNMKVIYKGSMPGCMRNCQ